MNEKIAVIGLGYVGLPLLYELQKRYTCIGLDKDYQKIRKIQNKEDYTNEIGDQKIVEIKDLVTTDIAKLADCNVFIITVQTPVDKYNIPDLDPLVSVSSLVSKYIRKGSLIIYESTVAPGTTDEICVPILATGSNLQINQDFGVGYAPERINPGDKTNTLKNINRIVSASSKTYLERVVKIYSSFLEKTPYECSNIKVAESAKIIENIQRDVNVALMNELSKVFNTMEINTSEVLNAANTKWNFLDFKPGLVGGHCIGIDPYYLSHASRKNNSSTELINHSRHINATMASYICGIIVKKCFQKNISAKDCNVLFCGLSFKKDVSDVRNSQSISLLMELNQYFPNIKIHDSKLSYDSEKTFSNFEPFQIKNTETKFDLIVVSVGHSVYEDLGADYFNALKSDNGLLIDIPSMFDANLVDFQL